MADEPVWIAMEAQGYVAMRAFYHVSAFGALHHGGIGFARAEDKGLPAGLQVRTDPREQFPGKGTGHSPFPPFRDRIYDFNGNLRSLMVPLLEVYTDETPFFGIVQ